MKKILIILLLLPSLLFAGNIIIDNTATSNIIINNTATGNIMVMNYTPPTYFVSTWKTDNAGTSNDNQITLPLTSTGTYNFDVEWGDGTCHHINTYNDAKVTHTYPSAGTYTIEIDGTINGWRFNYGGDKLKITDISQWGNLLVGTNEGAYFGDCSNLDVSATDELDVSGVTSLHTIFYNCTSLTTLNVSNWDVNSVTTFWRAFWNCPSLTTLNVNSWNISNVTTLYGIFYNCDSMTPAQMGAVKNWTITELTNANFFMNFCANSMSTTDYDELLINWQGQTHYVGAANTMPIDFNAATYTAGGAAATARAALVSDGWAITDGGTE